jgi:hypothetical protein
MAAKKRRLIGATLAPEWADKLDQICSSTKESKADFFKRMITNELAMIQGEIDNVRLKSQSISDKKIDLILSKQNAILNSMQDRNVKIERNIASVYYAIRIIFNQFYFILNMLRKVGSFQKDDMEKIRINSEEQSSGSFKKFLDRLYSGDTESIIDYCKTPQA